MKTRLYLKNVFEMMLRDIFKHMQDAYISNEIQRMIDDFRKVLSSDIEYTLPGTSQKTTLANIDFNFRTALQTLYKFNNVLGRNIIIEDEIDDLEKIYSLIVKEIVRLGKEYQEIAPGGLHYAALVCFFISYQTMAMVNDCNAFEMILKIMKGSEQQAIDQIFFKVRN